MPRNDDLVAALGLAIAALALGSLATRGPAGNLTLLLGGIAGALLARWHVDGRLDGRLLDAAAALCALAGAVLIMNVAQTALPSRSLMISVVAALMATALSLVARHRAAVLARS